MRFQDLVEDLSKRYMDRDEEIELKKKFKSELSRSKIDSNIAKALTNINKIPGIATIYSCSGHPEDLEQVPYIAFRVDREGEHKLLRWKNGVFKHLHRNFNSEFRILDLPTQKGPIFAFYGDPLHPEAFAISLTKIK